MSKKESIKKFREKFHFNVFKRLFKEFPLDDIETDISRPDFIVKLQNGSLGIEHTELFKNDFAKLGLSSRARYGNQEKIIKKARIQCEKNVVPPIWVRVRFSGSNENYNRNDIERISESLASCIENHVSEAKSKIILKSDDLHKVLPEVSRIDVISRFINGTEWLSEHRWEIVSASWVKMDFIDELQQCIEKKNKLYSDYRKQCNECWLLIVADRSNPSQGFDISEKTLKYSYKSKFDRIYYLEIMHDHLVQLKSS